MKSDYTTNSRYITHTIAFWKVGRIHFLSSGVEGLIYKENCKKVVSLRWWRDMSRWWRTLTAKIWCKMSWNTIASFRSEYEFAALVGNDISLRAHASSPCQPRLQSSSRLLSNESCCLGKMKNAWCEAHHSLFWCGRFVPSKARLHLSRLSLPQCEASYGESPGEREHTTTLRLDFRSDTLATNKWFLFLILFS